MNDHEDLTDRLNALGRQPVDPAVASRHLTAMATAPHRRNLMQRLRIVGAFAVGVLVGTTGLASAGALPGGMQDVAHDTLGAVGVNVPRAERYQGAECGGPIKNHGQYVKAQPKEKRAEAAASRCGKPVQAGADGEGKPRADAGGKPGAGGECGRPVWAGRGKPSQAEKDARKSACGDDDAGDKAAGAQADKPDGPDHDGAKAGPAAEDRAGDAPSSEPPAEVETTTTTAAPETTTTTATTTTTPPADTGEAPVVPELPVPDPSS